MEQILNQNPIRIAVTGAAGQIGYSLIFRIASGQLCGPNQPVILQLLEITPAMGALEGVAMELDDCAFPLLKEIELSDQSDKAFDGANIALLVGSRPRSKGMERKDLLEQQKEVLAEARNRGYDIRVVRKLMAIRRRDPQEVSEEDAVLQLYKDALGM